MKALTKISLIATLAVSLLIPSFSVKAQASAITTPATGYTCAEDVEYVKAGGYVVNWGARNETCVFLSEYAEAFYTGGYRYDTLSENVGGSSQSNASQSALYSALANMMKAKHSKQTGYQETRSMYCYTDCVSNDYNHISSFYSGITLSGTWDGGATWNREHTWPNSKGLGGNDENDIMMLRPTWVKENSSRSNTAYGESSSYFDPGEGVRGDCARIVLYVYTRWGNTGKMWGTSGVMENLDVLLKWMAEDPVDTWEMGRNDAVQSITGTRNVFVDYPEYAWLLFGRDIPENVTTPSGIANNGNQDDGSSDVSSDLRDSADSASGSDFSEPSASESVEEGCEHEYSDWFTVKQPTDRTDGEKIRTCLRCGDTQSEVVPKTSSEESRIDIDTDGQNCNATVGFGFVGAFVVAVCIFAVKKRRSEQDTE